jgi:hypothetical protein
MSMQKAAFAAMVTLALSAGMAQAGSRLFGDSVLNRSDGITDEITGSGPDMLVIAGSQSADALRDTVKSLRKDHRIHLIHATDEVSLKVYLDRHRLAAVPASGAVTQAVAQR